MTELALLIAALTFGIVLIAFGLQGWLEERKGGAKCR